MNSNPNQFLSGALLTFSLFFALLFIFTGLLVAGMMWAGWFDFFHPRWQEVAAVCGGTLLAWATLRTLTRRNLRIRS
jgi:hypothetical protein